MRCRRGRRAPHRGRGIGRRGVVFVALGLGANLDRRRQVLADAVRLLIPFLASPRVAPLFETEPLSEIPQGRFLNTALIGETRLAAGDLLAVAKATELIAGRRRAERWGPRPLDVDLLLYDELEIQTPELSVPHPRLRQRLFYLEPLAEIASGRPVPPDGATVAELRDRLGDQGVGRRIEWEPLSES